MKLALAPLPFIFLASPAVATPRYTGTMPLPADPANPILAALDWLQGTPAGNAVAAVAVITVALLGVMMLSGRLNWKLRASVILSCFTLFSSAAIVSGIQVAAAVAQ